MTNAEAIEILKERRMCAAFVDSEYVGGVDIEAIDIAISALEKQEQKMPCKVGDRVWLIVQGLSSPMPVPVCSLTWRGGKWSINADREETEPPKVVGFQIGKTAFLNREDAERALDGMNNDERRQNPGYDG